MAKQHPTIRELVDAVIIGIGTEFFKDYEGVRYVGQITSKEDLGWCQVKEPEGFDSNRYDSFNQPTRRIVGYPVNAWKWWQFDKLNGRIHYIIEWKNKWEDIFGR